MRRLVTLVLVVLLVGGAGYIGYLEWTKSAGEQSTGAARRGRRGGPDAGGPISVLTAEVKRADVPVTLEAVGTAQALNTVTVRSQVDGRLIALEYREGQTVRKGDVLARIDPTIYQAQYDQAVAKKAQDEANLANARIDLQRYQNLARTNYGSKQQADTQAATVAQLEAQIQSDQGAIDNAKAYLDYTTIRAPIDGRTGIRLVDEGNIVHAADATGIVVITQLKPISILFNLPQQSLRAVTTASARGPVAVTALDSDDTTLLDQGTLAVVDNQVDQTTGTVKAKAVFPNDDQQLWPGSFVNVRLLVDTLKNVVVVPTSAVQRGPNGTFVYAVEDGKATLKTVTVTQQTETEAVIASGVTPPEQVVTTGFVRLTDGSAVRIGAQAAEGEPASRAPVGARPLEGQAAPESRRRRRDGSDARREGGAGASGASGEEAQPRRRGGRPGTGQGGTGTPPTPAANEGRATP